MNRAVAQTQRDQALAWLELGPVLRLRPPGPAQRAPLAAPPAAASASMPVPVPAPVVMPVPGPMSAPAVMPVAEPQPVPVPVPTAPSPAQSWSLLQEHVRACTACALAQTRRQTVFGVGLQTAPLMIVGEAPGADEDARGEPFVGPAGKLLDQMLAAIGLSRERDAFICNVLKCRPPGNRDPTPVEVAACAGFLERQVALVRPQVMLLLGGFAARSILQADVSVGSQRGKVHRRTIAGQSLPIVVSYHPAYLLRNLPEKRKSWADLLLLSDQLRSAK